jgi:hypothetical protein
MKKEKIMKDYKLVRALPVARFYYQGSHSHPVRRTVLVTVNKKNYFKGYEMREAGVIRHKISQAPIKTYRKSKIAKIGQCGLRLRKRVPATMHTQTTYERQKLVDLVKRGI